MSCTTDEHVTTPGEGSRGRSGRGPKPWSFTSAYKRQTVEEYDATPEGGKGAILRLEGVYSSHVIEWCKALEVGTLASSAAKRAESPGPRPPRTRLSWPGCAGKTRGCAELRRVRERRAQARHPPHKKPELLADGPHQVWSCDITKLRGPVKGVWYQAYALIDIYSRYAVGHLVAAAESGQLAEALIAGAVDRHGVPHIVDADRDTSMTSGTVAELLVDVGIERSHSRPRVSNDNPYPEGQFKTLKYVYEFPERFGSLQDARTRCDVFFTAYNHELRHSAIGHHTPAPAH
jgi:transposase InsO family protein